MYAIGDLFQFETTPITYGQDFSWWRGTIPDTTLRLEEFTHKGKYVWLRGPGYGVIGNYGNSQIHVAVSELAKCSSHKPHIPRSWEAPPLKPRQQVREL